MSRIEGMVDTLVSMQTKFNNDTNGECWVYGVTKDGRTIDWNLCMLQESAEAIDSLNWKHWKDKDKADDMENFKMELVDILHFLLSECIITNHVVDIAPAIKLGIMNNGGVIANRFVLIDTIKLFMLDVLKHNIQDDGKHITESVYRFMDLVESVEGFSFKEMYQLYMGKNVLNTFRQLNGYDAGTYVKEFGGREDNVWLMEYLDSGVDVTYDNTMEYLDKVYKENTK